MLRYLLCAAGDITTSDVDLAAASGGMVVGFNLNPDENVLSHAKNLGAYLGLCAAGVRTGTPGDADFPPKPQQSRRICR